MTARPSNPLPSVLLKRRGIPNVFFVLNLTRDTQEKKEKKTNRIIQFRHHHRQHHRRGAVCTRIGGGCASTVRQTSSATTAGLHLPTCGVTTFFISRMVLKQKNKNAALRDFMFLALSPVWSFPVPCGMYRFGYFFFIILFCFLAVHNFFSFALQTHIFLLGLVCFSSHSKRKKINYFAYRKAAAAHKQQGRWPG